MTSADRYLGAVLTTRSTYGSNSVLDTRMADTWVFLVPEDPSWVHSCVEMMSNCVAR